MGNGKDAGRGRRLDAGRGRARGERVGGGARRGLVFAGALGAHPAPRVSTRAPVEITAAIREIERREGERLQQAQGAEFAQGDGALDISTSALALKVMDRLWEQ